MGDIVHGLPKMCTHCGAIGGSRLGICSVCGLSVCERCGNIQHSCGETKPVHDDCLRQAEDHFSMIKFVK